MRYAFHQVHAFGSNCHFGKIGNAHHWKSKIGEDSAGRFQSLGALGVLLIEGIECPVKVKSFFFRINHNDWDNVAFRVNFIKFENGREGSPFFKRI